MLTGYTSEYYPSNFLPQAPVAIYRGSNDELNC